MEKGAEQFGTLFLRTSSAVLKIQKILTSTFSSSLGTLSVVSLSVKQNRTKNETQAILPAAAEFQLKQPDPVLTSGNKQS